MEHNRNSTKPIKTIACFVMQNNRQLTNTQMNKIADTQHKQ